eukprot:522681-Hanusia_phi.AAC.1
MGQSHIPEWIFLRPYRIEKTARVSERCYTPLTQPAMADADMRWMRRERDWYADDRNGNM